MIVTKAAGGALGASLKGEGTGSTLSFREPDEHKQQRFKVQARILAPEFHKTRISTTIENPREMEYYLHFSINFNKVKP